MKKKALITSLALLLVALMCLSTATYAWFSASGKASANGIKIRATVPASLYIKNGIESNAANISESTIIVAGFEDTVSGETVTPASPVTLSPATVQTVSGEVGVYYPATDAAFTEIPTASTVGAVDSSLLTKAIAIQTSSNLNEITSGYCVARQFTLVKKVAAASASATPAAYKLTVNVKNIDTASGASAEIYKALRCGLMIDGQWLTSGAATVNGTNATFTISDATHFKLTDNTVKTVCFVIWYEGTAVDCIANKARVADDLDVDLVFETA
jgi:hypothetical protein